MRLRAPVLRAALLVFLLGRQAGAARALLGSASDDGDDGSDASYSISLGPSPAPGFFRAVLQARLPHGRRRSPAQRRQPAAAAHWHAGTRKPGIHPAAC